MNKQKIDAVATEAAKIMKEQPHLKIYQAVALAKEVLKYRKKPLSDTTE